MKIINYYNFTKKFHRQTIDKKSHTKNCTYTQSGGLVGRYTYIHKGLTYTESLTHTHT